MKNFKTEIKWAIIFSVFTLLWSYAEKILGLHDTHINKHALYTNLIAIPYIIIFYLAIKEKRDHFFKKNMNWKQGVISGGILSVIIALISPAVQYLTAEVITPEYFSNAIEYAVEHKKMNPKTAESFFNLRFYMIQAVFGSLTMGIVTAAIVSLLLRTKKA